MFCRQFVCRMYYIPEHVDHLSSALYPPMRYYGLRLRRTGSVSEEINEIILILCGSYLYDMLSEVLKFSNKQN